MDRNSAIGLTLIAVLLLVYFNFFSPKPTPEASKPIEITQSDTSAPADSLHATAEVPDSLLVKQYGDLGSLLTGTENTTKVETADLVVTFTNHGGKIKEVELKKFKTYGQKPLMLADEKSNTFALLATFEGKELNFYNLYYTAETQKKGDSTVITFTASLGDGKSLSHVYTVPPAGYEIKYSIQTTGLASSLNSDQLTYTWHDRIPLQEKDIVENRKKTNVNFYTIEGDFDGTSDASTNLETEALATPVKWIAIHQQFFLSSIIAENNFKGGELSTVADLTSTSIVKDARVKLFIAKEDLLAGKTNFRYYFGPNDLPILNTVTEGFSKNLYLGWPPVIWINKFFFIPIFNFLELFITNYGIVIIILVFLIKIILLPLSYRSFLGMAKMKLLKPELDLIKEKNGDNLAQNQQDQMKLYKEAGVNPFSGCVPLLLQLPILFSMIYLFPGSIHLRQASFLWADDLSTYDSIATLPFSIPFYGDHVSLFVLLMTASTIVYTWQNNQVSAVEGPMKTMSLIMPVFFLFILNSFSAGLSFYYFVSNLVTFAQQAIIKRFVDEDKIKAVMEDHKKKLLAGAPTGKKSKFMTKLEEAMKASQEAQKKNKK
ncbi:MAG TPA: membrane protein insertase YidC [Cyclobacteriaceae bacterium]|jgi:YidC/Oxa1 family membrane protein insertase|nr:membrane protein insertase YidC [Cyclobacteriaceae bacterium]